MRRPFILFLLWLCLIGATSALASSGKVLKVLPQFLDLKGRHTLSPSLYDRDAYQAQLRRHPEQRSGVRFCVQWKGRSDKDRPLKLRIELRGMAKGDLPVRKILETEVVPGSGWSRWTTLLLTGEDYQQFGEITAWRVALFDGALVLDDERSFLW